MRFYLLWIKPHIVTEFRDRDHLMVLFIKVLFNALYKIPGVAFTFAGDDHDVLWVNNYSFHILSILYPYLFLRVEYYKNTAHRLFYGKPLTSLPAMHSGGLPLKIVFNGFQV